MPHNHVRADLCALTYSSSRMLFLFEHLFTFSQTRYHYLPSKLRDIWICDPKCPRRSRVLKAKVSKTGSVFCGQLFNIPAVHSFIHSFIHSFSQSFIHSFIHSLYMKPRRRLQQMHYNLKRHIGRFIGSCEDSLASNAAP